MDWSVLSCSEYLENAEKILLQEMKRLEEVLYGNEYQQKTIKLVLHKFNEKILREYKVVLLNKETEFLFMIEHEQHQVHGHCFFGVTIHNFFSLIIIELAKSASTLLSIGR